MADHPAAARNAYQAAITLLDSAVTKSPDDERIHASRGLALAGLGRVEEAREEARWLQGSLMYRTDAIDGPDVAEDRARVLAQVGDADAGPDEIERLLASPSLVSVHTLRLDPLLDPIRAHPRFQRLLAVT